MAIATDSGLQNGNPVSDAYGSLTQTAGTIITRVAPPRANLRTKIGGFIYTAGATAHTVTMLMTLDQTTLSTDAALGQAVIKLKKALVALDGSALAANDFVILQHDDGTWKDYMVSSVSGLDVTLSANLAKRVKQDTTAYFMGAIGDHTDRQYLVDASTTLNIPAGADSRVVLATGVGNNQPILVHSANATNAGNLKWLAFFYGDA